VAEPDAVADVGDGDRADCAGEVESIGTATDGVAGAGVALGLLKSAISFKARHKPYDTPFLHKGQLLDTSSSLTSAIWPCSEIFCGTYQGSMHALWYTCPISQGSTRRSSPVSKSSRQIGHWSSDDT